ncbi:MAG: RpiB/LacA/LacB family sugar-phosphate isomerase [Candidatus Latescibacterota bacterium]|jgi:ribose 5-phosphate isomerase B
MDEELIKKIVAEVVRRLKALEGVALDAVQDPPVNLVTEDVVRQVVAKGGDTVYVTPKAIVTPLARDLVRHQKVRLVVVADEDAVELAENPKSFAIAIGADHRGFALKEKMKAWLQSIGREVMDCGAHSPQEGSFVSVAQRVAECVVAENLFAGIVIDGGGSSSAIVVNKVAGIRGVACHDVTSAKYARAHIDANVLCLGVGVVGDTVAQEIVATWLSTPFEGGRFATLVREIGEMEHKA